MRQWKVVLAGECMISRPVTVYDEPEFQAVLDLLRTSDVTYAHLEMNFGAGADLQWAARGDWSASFMIAEPALATDLKRAGIDIMSLAHNHSFDFGAPVLLSTGRHCREAGLVCAGTGADLEDAREPKYLETSKGRVALISVSTGNKGYEWAGQPKAALRGRPGVNPQRVVMTYEVDAAAAAQLRRLSTALEIGGPRKGKGEGSEGKGSEGKSSEIAFNFPTDQSTRSAVVFEEADGFKVKSALNPLDLAGNMRSVEEAMRMADMVMIAHHFNVAEGKRGDRPPEFVRRFAKAAIDAGADMYLGHGWHKTMGIEIYQGRPIFYGLGNFIAQSEFIRNVPADSYEAWNHDVEKLATLHPAVHPLHPGLDFPEWWSSAIVEMDYDGKALKQIRLHPVELGREATSSARITRSTGSGDHALTEGRPFLADRENGAIILERLRALSAELGTRVEIEDGVGVIRL